MLIDYLLEEIEAENMDNIWFQQDGATSIAAHVTIDSLRPIFATKKCNLTLLGYYLWRAMKATCQVNHPGTIQELKHEIQAVFAELRSKTIENVFKNWMDQMRYCQVSCRDYLTEIAFRK